MTQPMIHDTMIAGVKIVVWNEKDAIVMMAIKSEVDDDEYGAFLGFDDTEWEDDCEW